MYPLPYKLIFSLLFSFGLTVVLAQYPLMAIEDWEQNAAGELKPLDKRIYGYDQAQNLNSTHELRWVDSLNYFKLRRIERQSFSNENLLESFTSVSHPDPLVGFYMERFNFYSGSCLDSTIEQRFFNDELERRTKIFYNPLTCKPDSAFLYYNQVEDIGRIKRYFYTDNDELQVYYLADAQGNFTIAADTTEIMRNDMGLITRFYSTFSDLFAELYTFEYDEFGNEIRRTSYFISAFETRIDDEFISENTYDQDGKLISVKSVFWDHLNSSNPPQIVSIKYVDYEYTCDDLLHRRITTYEYSDSKRIRYYHYETGHDCDLTESEQELNIRPNPTSDFVWIESEILQTENCQIVVTDMLGRELRRIKVNRIPNYLLDLSDLDTGVYVVWIYGERYSFSKQLMKL